MGNNLVLLRVIRGNGAIYIFETKGANVQAKNKNKDIFWDGYVKYIIN